MAPEKPTQKHLTFAGYGEIPTQQNHFMQSVSKNHIQCFNWALETGLENVVRSVRIQRFSLPARVDGEAAKVVTIRISEPQIRSPFDENLKRAITPAECRNKLRTYQGQLMLKVTVEVDGAEVFSSDRSFGELPIMLRSQKCTLGEMTPRQLVAAGEDADEFGGYFIVNGKEKVFRFLIAMRRNFPFCIKRLGWRTRDKFFSEKGVIIRCVNRSECASVNVLHYLTNGTAVLQVTRVNELFYLPVMMVLRCLGNVSDREIYKMVLRDDLEHYSFARNCVNNMLQQMRNEGLGNRGECVNFVAGEFRGKLRAPETHTSEQVVQQFIDETVLPHLSPSTNNRLTLNTILANRAKSELVCYMLRRLLLFAQDQCAAESPDSLANQEVISAGSVWLCVLRESLEKVMYSLRYEILAAHTRLHNNRKRKPAGDADLNVAEVDAELPLAKKGRGRKSASSLALGDDESFQRLIQEAFTRAASAIRRVSSDITYVFATGNVPRKSSVQLHQKSGLTVTAERINMQRFLSHFRAVHRGQYFTQLRTTECRRLGGEAWGFICPVHTPDGAPCGLLNHLTAEAQVTSAADFTDGVKAALKTYGMLSNELMTTTGAVPEDVEYSDSGRTFYAFSKENQSKLFDSRYYDVVIDGQPVGRIASEYVERAVEELRYRKCDANDFAIPMTMEICLIKHTPYASQFPGLYIFCHANRIVRPVYNLKASALVKHHVIPPASARADEEPPTYIEWLGTFEQVYLNIAVYNAEILDNGLTTHREISPQSILSVIASFTPFSEMNPSPRNMYQCQMGKQTIGIPTLAWPYRADAKMYRLETPQSPLVRPIQYDRYDMDAYPIGTNAVIAVIAYSGYTMEDAVVLNRASVERGFAYGTIFKSEHVNVVKIARDRSQPHTNFAFGFFRAQAAAGVGQFLTMTKHEHSKCFALFDSHGLPRCGARLYKNDPFYCVVDLETKEQRVEYFTAAEVAYVESVKVLEQDMATRMPTSAIITVRIPRPPIIGDKMASRCGQKGICARLIPAEDMPFIGTSGVVPDILFNAHGFGSRMTMSKVVELMAGKYATVSGEPVDAATFNEYTKNDEPGGEQYDSPALYFGEKLRKIGFEDSGVEIMYHGSEGTEIEARIYCGVIYYQRLRHMVSDKYQARPTGPSDPLTLQPIKGRKRGGGIRVGEMERDAMLAHGISFMLNDRLLNCSDRKTVRMCRRCGDLLSAYTVKTNFQQASIGGSGGGDVGNTGIRQWSCLLCGSGDAIAPITIPWVLRYMAVELAVLNIRLKFRVSEPLCDAVVV